MKQLLYIFIVLASATTCLSGQVVVSVGNATPQVGDTFSIDVTVTGFDSLSSAQFRLMWDPTIIRLNEFDVPVDTIPDVSPFRINANPNRITFLYENSNGVGEDGSLADGSTLMRLFFTAIGGSGDTTCLMVDPSLGVEFIKLASEELSSMVIVGCVHLQGVNSLPSHEHQKINYHWQSNDHLIVSHSPSAYSALVQVYTLDGRVMKESIVAPHTTTTPIFVSQDWQRSTLVVRYSQNGNSHTQLIAGPR